MAHIANFRRRRVLNANADEEYTMSSYAPGGGVGTGSGSGSAGDLPAVLAALVSLLGSGSSIAAP
jgi:hypothetical protein